MSLNLESRQDLLQSINLTTKLQKSLRKLLSNKKKIKQDMRDMSTNNQYDQKDPSISELTHRNYEKQISNLRRENQQLLEDNEYLSRQILKYKEESRELKKQINSYKKYLKFLQGYNEDLKKQMIYWMKKPKFDRNHDIEDKNQKSFQNLISQVTKLRAENQVKQRQLKQIKNSFQLDYMLPQQNLSQPLKQKKQFSSEQPFHKNSQAYQSSQHQIEKNRKSINQNYCSSCNYKNSVKKYRSKVPNKTFNKKNQINKKQMERKSLCECHRKYIQTSEFLY